MKASDVISQLFAKLPGLTDTASTNISITTLTRVGTTVTAVCAAKHDLATDDFVTINGAVDINLLTSLTFADGIASATTTSDHDLTESTGFDQATVSGATESEYNAAGSIRTAINRRNFTYPVTGTPASPATGTPALEQTIGYNGLVQVTVIDLTTFTYQVSGTPVSPAQGTIETRTKARISGAVSLERAVEAYTEQGVGELFFFVVLGDPDVSKDRASQTDASATLNKGDDWRQRLVESFSVFVFAPATDSISARDVRDDMEDVRPLLYKALLGVKLPSTLAEAIWSRVVPVGDAFSGESTQGFYIHEFQFERSADITLADIAPNDSNRAFRDIDLKALNSFSKTLWRVETSLDDEIL